MRSTNDKCISFVLKLGLFGMLKLVTLNLPKYSCFCHAYFSVAFAYLLNGWILLNVEAMLKILHYLIMSKLLLSNVRFSASFRRLEESTP